MGRGHYVSTSRGVAPAEVLDGGLEGIANEGPALDGAICPMGGPGMSPRPQVSLALEPCGS